MFDRIPFSQSVDQPVRGDDSSQTNAVLRTTEGFPPSLVPLLHHSHEHFAGQKNHKSKLFSYYLDNVLIFYL